MPQPLTLAPLPLSRAALEFSLTGFRITGSDGKAYQAGGNWPIGPYTVTDEAGLDVGFASLDWHAREVAIRAWRARCESSDGGYTFAGVQQQAALKTRIRRLEVEIARCEAEDEAIDYTMGVTASRDLDRKLDRYADALRDLEAAVRDEEAQAEYAEAQRGVAA